jgi:ribonuclease P protein component
MYMLAKKNRLVKRTDFSAIYAKGTYAASDGLAIKYLRSGLMETRLGFPIGKNFSKKAVERNKARRILREAVRLNLAALKPGFDIVIMPRPGFEKNASRKVADILKSIFKKAKLII